MHDPALDQASAKLPWPLSGLQPHQVTYAVYRGNTCLARRDRERDRQVLNGSSVGTERPRYDRGLAPRVKPQTVAVGWLTRTGSAESRRKPAGKPTKTTRLLAGWDASHTPQSRDRESHSHTGVHGAPSPPRRSGRLGTPRRVGDGLRRARACAVVADGGRWGWLRARPPITLADGVSPHRGTILAVKRQETTGGTRWERYPRPTRA